LGAARNALLGVLSVANPNGQTQLASRVNDAIKEINTALTIK
jgi:tetrahydromethanopterin S-methyltransferase subunit E